MASNPKFFHPVECTQDVQTSFDGGFYGSRLENIYQLLDAGLDVHVFGPGWKLSGIKNTPYGYALKNMKDHVRTIF